MATADEQYEAPVSASLLDRSLQPEALSERCLVQQYRTTQEQQTILYDHSDGKDRSALPIEWVIDIADESNGWFYGTAYHYDDSNGTLHVMVPDKVNPTFDGTVQLDHRTIHLIECVDGNTDALFNQIVRESTAKCKWDVEWFEEGGGDEKLLEGVEDEADDVFGKWNETVAKYYFRITNQLLVEDAPEEGQTQVGFVLLTADLNVKFKYCHKERGIVDFNRLICENTVQSLDETREYALSTYEARGNEQQTELDTNYYDEQQYYDQSQGQSQSQSQAEYPPEDEGYNEAYNQYEYDQEQPDASPTSPDSPTYDESPPHTNSKSNTVSRTNSNNNSKKLNRADSEKSTEMTQLGDDEQQSQSQSQSRRSSRKDSDRQDRRDDGRSDRVPPVRKMAEMSKQLKECLTEILEEREKNVKMKHVFMNDFMKFALDGDLDAG